MDLGAPQQDVPAAAEFTDALFATLLHTILAERVQKCKRKKALRQVLVKWTGFHVVDATWEPIANMPDAVVQQWQQLQQTSLRMDGEQ